MPTVYIKAGLKGMKEKDYESVDEGAHDCAYADVLRNEKA